MPKYDIACIGAGISGLATATLLAKTGKTVCLIDPADRPGGCIAPQELAGFRYAPGPPITYGFEPGGILQKLFADLGLPVSATSPCSGYQVVMPDHRISVSGDLQETLDELCREFSDTKSGLTKLYREVRDLSERSSKSRLSSYVYRKRSAAAYLESYQFNKSILSYFDVQSRFFFGYTLQQMPLASLILMITRAPRYIPGGFAGIADQLLSLFQQRGTWYQNEPFPELQARSNRITGINMSREHIETRTVILNVPGDQRESILLLGIRDQVVPVGMFPIALCIEKGEYVGNYYSLFLSPVDDPTSAPAGMRSLIAAFPSGHSQDQPVDVFMNRISTVIPFLQEFHVHASMQDAVAMRCSLPPAVTVKPSVSRSGRSFLTHCSAKNLMIIPDSVRSILPALSTARNLALKLR